MIILIYFCQIFIKNLCCGRSLESLFMRNKQNYPLIIIKYHQIHISNLFFSPCYLLLHTTQTSPYKSYPKFAPNISVKSGVQVWYRMKTSDFSWFLHKIICCVYLLESPWLCTSIKYSQHMISLRKLLYDDSVISVKLYSTSFLSF